MDDAEVELRRDAPPTCARAIVHASNLFELKPQVWLFGEPDGIDDGCRLLCDTYMGAPPKVRSVLLAMNEAGANESKNMGLG